MLLTAVVRDRAGHQTQQQLDLPTAGGFPIRRTPANTGPLGVFDPALGRNLTYADLDVWTGSATLSTPGASFRRVLFPTMVKFGADDLTFDQCAFKPVRPLYVIRRVTGFTPKRIRFVDCEIDGQGTDGDAGDAPSAALEPGIEFAMTRCRVRRCTDALKPQNSNITIVDSLLGELAFPTGSHSDVLQIAGGGAQNVLIRGCTLDGWRADIARYGSSSVIQWGSFPTAEDGHQTAILRNVVIEDGYADGGGYASRLGATSAAVCQNVQIRRMRIGLRHRFGVFSGGNQAADGGIPTASGCVWDVTGTTDFGRQVVAGQPV